MTTGQLDIAKLLQEVRAEIEEKYSPEDIARYEIVANDESFIRLGCENSYNDSICTERLIRCIENQWIQVDRDIPGSGISRFVKKTVRKLSRFLIVPIVNDQNDFNVNVTAVLFQLLSRLDEQERMILELQDRLKSEE